MKNLGVNEIRELFLQFFESKDHLRLKSFSVVPRNDKSLLLINSGMAPMKAYFTGQETPPSKRVTTCQKCIRTGDIDNVGKTARHGTFFEMLAISPLAIILRTKSSLGLGSLLPNGWKSLRISCMSPSMRRMTKQAKSGMKRLVCLGTESRSLARRITSGSMVQVPVAPVRKSIMTAVPNMAATALPVALAVTATDTWNSGIWF